MDRRRRPGIRAEMSTKEEMRKKTKKPPTLGGRYVPFCAVAETSLLSLSFAGVNVPPFPVGVGVAVVAELLWAVLPLLVTDDEVVGGT